MPSRRSLLRDAAAGTAGLLLANSLGARSASSASPTSGKVIGPITGGKHGWPFGAYFGDMGKIGYIEEEYFLEGDARRYAPVGALTEDGRWTVMPAPDTAAYKTRILVRRPRNPGDFNGTVVVEWTNVTSGFALNVCEPRGLYGGFAYVSVASQRVGVHGYAATGNPMGLVEMGLVQWDPQRYAGLHIPSDNYSYDIFTQAARAIGPNRKLSGPDPMGGLKVRKLIAAGASQSGFRLISYANGVQPLESAFDAIMPIICAGNASPFVEELEPVPSGADAKAAGHRIVRIPAKVRDDLSTPVMEINTQTEALTYYPRRQPDTDRFVEWEVAGASHVPEGGLDTRWLVRDGLGAILPPLPHQTIKASEVIYRPTIDAAIGHVHKWVNGGPPPPSQAKMEISDFPLDYVLDKSGNAVGGVRLPDVEVPIARYTGTGNPVGALLGQTLPFSPEELKLLYPAHDDYVAKVKKAAEAAFQAGVIPRYRVDEYVANAEMAAIPG